MKEFKQIGLALKPSEVKDFGNLLTNLFRWLLKREKNIYVLTKEKKRLDKSVTQSVLKEIRFIEEEKLYQNMDLIISLGGDGTFLGVSRRIASDIPVFSVNLGRLGFITEFSKMDFYEHLNSVLANKFKLQKTYLSSVVLLREGKKVQEEFFFNDAVFSKNSIARMVSLSVEIDGEHMQDITGDGIIISSTFGSTAYSLAAGGPIVHPEVQAYIITPICPHSLNHRPVVIPNKSEIEIRLAEPDDDVHVTIDGQEIVPIHYRDCVQINRESKRYITTITNEDKTYFHTLKEKFIHGRREVAKE